MLRRPPWATKLQEGTVRPPNENPAYATDYRPVNTSTKRHTVPANAYDDIELHMFSNPRGGYCENRLQFASALYCYIRLYIPAFEHSSSKRHSWRPRQAANIEVELTLNHISPSIPLIQRTRPLSRRVFLHKSSELKQYVGGCVPKFFLSRRRVEMCDSSDATP